jgi:exosortase/archaeosortase family protein
VATVSAAPRGLRPRGLGLPLGVTWPAVAAVAAVAVAYRYSFFTLGRGLSLQTPLAYLALVPVGALMLLWISSVRSRAAPARPRDLPLDFALGRAVGLTFLLAALAITVLLPGSLGARFWLYRLDLLSLPFFVAGLIALLFGVRRLWALKSAVVFLLLAWPVPYGLVLGNWLDVFTDVTANAVRARAAVLPIARAAAGDSTLFFIDHGGSSFAVSVGSACSGVNSLVGFVLLGTVLMFVVRGTTTRRLLWLGLGLSIIWLLNVARIELVFATGAALGPDIAFETLHPVAGLFVFNLGLLAMIWLVPRFGLRFVELDDRPIEPEQRRPRHWLRSLSVLGLGLALAGGIGLANGSYARYEQITGDLGTARLIGFDVRQAQIPAWSSAYVESVDQARQFFGSQARWDRLIYTATPAAQLRSSHPIYVDVIDTDDAGALAAYTVADCYQFHHFRIDAQLGVDIGAGVTAQVVTYFDPKDRTDWSAISWEWPKEYNGQLRYERIVVFIPDSNTVQFTGFDPSAPVQGDAAFHDTQRFLATAARTIVQSQLDAAAAAARAGTNG